MNIDNRFVGWISAANRTELLKQPTAPRNYGKTAADEYIRKRQSEFEARAHELPGIASLKEVCIKDQAGNSVFYCCDERPGSVGDAFLSWLQTSYPNQFKEIAYQPTYTTTTPMYVYSTPALLNLYGFSVKTLLKMAVCDVTLEKQVSAYIPALCWRRSSWMADLIDLEDHPLFDVTDKHTVLTYLKGGEESFYQKNARELASYTLDVAKALKVIKP